MGHIHNNQHFFGVVGQCHKPYREFSYCDRCNKYREDDIKPYMTRKQFKALTVELSTTDNPIYYPDSNTLLLEVIQ